MAKRLKLESQWTTVTIRPGEIHCSLEPQIITTLLGSCVAVCLFDPVRKAGGMNHIVLPAHPIGISIPEADPRYGPAAIGTLVELMESIGARRSRMEAKVFGGATVIPEMAESFAVGERNVEFTMRALEALGIPVVAHRVLGSDGMVVKMATVTGDVWVRSVSGDDQSAPQRLLKVANG